MKRMMGWVVWCGFVLTQGLLAQQPAAKGDGKAVAAESATVKPAAPPMAADESQMNPVAGMQTREEVFEFAAKPQIQGSAVKKYAITFASKAACDATVAIINKDGKIIRHLASGVLGKNAPWPFQQNSLAQKIEWDGCDDRGDQLTVNSKQSEAPPTTANRSLSTVHFPPYSVRVSLGLKATFGKILAWHPKYRQRERDCLGLAADKDGVYMWDSTYWNQLRKFDHHGDYVRTLYPPAADLMPEQRKGMAYVKESDGGELPACSAYGLSGLVGDGHSQSAVLAAGGRVFAKGGGDRESPAYLACVGTDGSIENLKTRFLFTGKPARRPAPKGSFVEPDIRLAGAYGLGASPDGKFLYVSIPGLDAVWRLDNGPTLFEGKGDLCAGAPFFGERDKSGDDDRHLNTPAGVGCDKDGNVYICDSGNNRILVVKPDASMARTIKFEAPHQVVVSPKTGELYVGSLKKKDRWIPVVTKLSADGSALATFEGPAFSIHSSWKGPLSAFCVDLWADQITVWLPGTAGIVRVADHGNSFEILENTAATVAAEAPNMPAWGLYKWEMIAADNEREILYAMWADGTKIDPQTGKMSSLPNRKRWPLEAEQIATDMDGRVYVKGHACEYLYRLDQDGKIVPFPKGRDGRTPKNVVSQEVAGGALIGMAQKTGRGFMMGICVAPNGEVYSGQFGDALDPKAVTRVSTQTRVGLMENKYSGNIIYSYNADGSLKNDDVVADIPSGTYGMRVDRQGNIYLPLGARMASVPRGLDASAGQSKAFSFALNGYIGTVVKVKPGARCVWGKGPFLTGRQAFDVDGLAWGYFGQSTITTTIGSCVCPNSQFDLDYFARAFIPQAYCSSVAVLDTNGNEILRIGRYGNADSQGPKSLVPKPEIAYGFPLYVAVSDKALYVSDVGNARVVRADLGYNAEEIVPVP